MRVAVVIVATAALLGTYGCAAARPPAPESCPPTWGGKNAGGWVPRAADLDGMRRTLVPGDPAEALICAYPGTNTSMGGERLAGTKAVTGAARMARDLRYLPLGGGRRICSLVGGRMTNYLVRFTYPDGGVLWVGSAEEVNSCAATTNGAATSHSYIGPSLTAAYRSGDWRLVRPADPCAGPDDRRGQEERLVPDRPMSVLVCTMPGDGSRAARAEHGTREATALATSLNALDTRPGGNTCHGIPGADRRWYRLVFSYSEGPPAGVRFLTDCDPALGNGLLQANPTDAVRDQVTRLAPP